jgi:predicted chitinase
MIGIEITYGASEVDNEDKWRAVHAAEAALEAAGVTEQAAYAAYCAQWMEHDDEARMTGDALAWVAAIRAANAALTQGWHRPGEAACSLTA